MSDDVFGRPVRGEITPTKRAVPQDDPADLITKLDAVLAYDGVQNVRWEGYTPYFNDGEPCVYSVGDVSVKFNGVDSGGDYEDGYFNGWVISHYIARGEDSYTLSLDTVKTALGAGVIAEDFAKDFGEFTRALASGRHDEFLKRSFGDHARVTATREGFDVEFYEHD